MMHKRRLLLISRASTCITLLCPLSRWQTADFIGRYYRPILSHNFFSEYGGFFWWRRYCCGVCNAAYMSET